jgi:hypothetical protein
MAAGKEKPMPRIRALAALALAAVLAVAACATSPAPDRFDIRDMQRRLDDRGVGFGLTQVPGENAVLFQVRFRTSEAEADEAMSPEAAAALAAPEGCTLNRVEPAPDGALKAVYDC